MSSNMRLDENVVRSLDLFESNGSCNTNETLYGLLNRCRTAHGKRLLEEWIKMPLLDVHKINERLDIVEALIADTEISQTLSNCLSRFPDIDRILKSFQKSKATLQDVYKLYQAVILIPNFIGAIRKLVSQESKSVNQCLLEPLQGIQKELSRFIDFVTVALDLENIRNFEVYVNPNKDPRLASLKEEMLRLEENMKKEANKTAEKLELEMGKSLKFETNSQWGYHFRVTNKDERAIRVSGIKVLDSSKAGVRFHSNALANLNDSYSKLKKDYETVQEKLAEEILRVAGTYFDPLETFGNLMATLDVLLSFAVVSGPYVRPIILDQEERVLELRDARHPCLETQKGASFIPNNVVLRKDQTEFLLITGPNMGGKSTYLRQTGLIVLMAQIGCFVPCSYAKLSVVDAIFTRIGASDAQLEGTSTFRMEMVEMAGILEAATSNSLVLIDELGRGTSTYDGCSLAWAIAEHISKNVRCWCLFATHFHELTALDIDAPMVQNLHVTADIFDGQFTLLYQVLPGPCESSFGIHIAEALGLPKSITADATQVLNEFAWSRMDEAQQSKTDEPVDCGQTLRNSSAAGFVTQMKRILCNDKEYSTATDEEKAGDIRKLLASYKGNDSATVPR